MNTNYMILAGSHVHVAFTFGRPPASNSRSPCMNFGMVQGDCPGIHEHLKVQQQGANQSSKDWQLTGHVARVWTTRRVSISGAFKFLSTKHDNI